MKFDISYVWTLLCGLATGGALNPIVQKILKWVGLVKTDSISKVHQRIDDHEEKDNGRFEEMKDFIRASEDRIREVVEGGVGRLEVQIKDQTERTDKRFEIFEKTNQNLLFRYFDLVDKNKIKSPAATGTDGIG